MDELIRFIRKEKHKDYLELFMIIDEISKVEDIISFTYTKDLFIVQTGVNDYYRIKLRKEELN